MQYPRWLVPLALVVAGVRVPLDTRTDAQLNDKSD